jgi:hypothetical protein
MKEVASRLSEQPPFGARTRPRFPRSVPVNSLLEPPNGQQLQLAASPQATGRHALGQVTAHPWVSRPPRRKTAVACSRARHGACGNGATWTRPPPRGRTAHSRKRYTGS